MDHQDLSNASKKGKKLLKNIFDWKIMISTNFHCICILEVVSDMWIVRLETFLAFDQKIYIRVRVYVVASRFVDSLCSMYSVHIKSAKENHNRK